MPLPSMERGKIKKTINSRNKGKSAEREVRDLIQPTVDDVFRDRGMEPPQLKRNLMQSMEGGHDLTGAPGIAIEVKRQETYHLDKWWEQAEEQGRRANAVPILIYRRNHAQWRVRMVGLLPIGVSFHETIVDISLGDFLEWYRLYLTIYLDQKK